MIYAIIKDDINRPTAFLYPSWEALHTELFSPSTILCGCVEFKTHGKTYKERKESARDLVATFAGFDSDYSGAGLSWVEYSEIYHCFESIGKRFGLLKEFHANGIC